MPDLVLDERKQRSLRALLAEEPVSGRPVPSRQFLENLAVLVPCDAVGACLALNEGPVIEMPGPPGRLLGRVRRSSTRAPGRSTSA